MRYHSVEPAFAGALEEAVCCCVAVLTYDCTVEPDSLTIRNPVRWCCNMAAKSPL